MVSWVRAPLRVDLSAGWTDAAPFTDRHVGSLVNLAIDKFQVYDGKEIRCTGPSSERIWRWSGS